jgi:hypothetical protein
VLWYVSGSPPAQFAAAGIVAASLVEEVVEGPPSDLHGRFQHLGVWRLEEIERAAHGGIVQAFRFVDTELLERPVTLPRLRQLGIAPPVAPRLVAPEVFASVYREGVRRE